LRAARNGEDFCASERAVHGLTQEFATDLTAKALQAICDDPRAREEGLAFVRAKAAERGIELRVERRRDTPVRTASGREIRVRATYACAVPRGGKKAATRGAQGTGVYPVLDMLGVVGRSTPALRLLVARAVCESNSVSSARELLEMGGTSIDHKGALRLTYLTCDDALRHRAAGLRTLWRNDDGEFAGRRVVVTVDGGRINIRRRVAGRPRKGGRKQFVTEWREPKVLTLYVLDENGRRDRSVRSVIDGTLGDADAVYELVCYHLFRLGGHKASEVCVVGDGAVWIWNRAQRLRESLGLAEERFHEVVDYFHAIERLGTYAKARSRWSDKKRTAWLSEQRRRLKAGAIEEIEEVFSGLRSKERRAEAKAALDTELEYWSRNRERLRFASFREAGLPNGSGAVESSVRRVVNLRMKGASVSWLEEHAEGVLHLRAFAKSERWEELEKGVLSTTGWRPTARNPKRAA
jgi:hypothetical protein